MSNLPKTKIIRSNRKTLALMVTPDASLVVKAPHFTPDFFINAFIKQHKDWIEKQQKKVLARTTIHKRTYTSGDSFLFLGMNLQLQVGDYPEVFVDQEKLCFPVGLQFRAQKQLTYWYKKQAQSIITKQLEYYAQQMKTTYTGLSFSDTKSKWGSCTHENSLQFNWRLVMAPILVINYVVVHELAHTIEKNHSREFWKIVRQHNPSYQRQRNWLKKNGSTLVI